MLAVLGGALLAMGDWRWAIGYWVLDALRAIGRFAMGYWLLAMGYGRWVIFLQIIFVLFAYVKDLY